jgi:hypothetical protein
LKSEVTILSHRFNQVKISVFHNETKPVVTSTSSFIQFLSIVTYFFQSFSVILVVETRIISFFSSNITSISAVIHDIIFLSNLSSVIIILTSNETTTDEIIGVISIKLISHSTSVSL